GRVALAGVEERVPRERVAEGGGAADRQAGVAVVGDGVPVASGGPADGVARRTQVEGYPLRRVADGYGACRVGPDEVPLDDVARRPRVVHRDPVEVGRDHVADTDAADGIGRRAAEYRDALAAVPQGGVAALVETDVVAPDDVGARAARAVDLDAVDGVVGDDVAAEGRGAVDLVVGTRLDVDADRVPRDRAPTARVGPQEVAGNDVVRGEDADRDLGRAVDDQAAHRAVSGAQGEDAVGVGARAVDLDLGRVRGPSRLGVAGDGHAARDGRQVRAEDDREGRAGEGEVDGVRGHAGIRFLDRRAEGAEAARV